MGFNQPTAMIEHAAIKTDKDKIRLFTTEYYTACTIGGILSCGITHAAVTPLDLVKCRRQVNPAFYSSIFDGWKQISKKSGFSGLWEGVLPTAIGYSFQGACKYGFYEYFKHSYSGFFDPKTAENYRTLIYLSASASAEFIADVALCPWEAVKVRMQTSMDPFSTSTLKAVQKIYKFEGLSGFYGGLGPLWLRQIPYTMMKFTAFERTVEAIYKYLLSKPKIEYNKIEQLGVTFAAGYWAGIFCALVSHPADTVVSKLNNRRRIEGETITRSISNILKELGPVGVWRGLGARIFMIGTLTAFQWFIYDTYKVNVGLPTSGASK